MGPYYGRRGSWQLFGQVRVRSLPPRLGSFDAHYSTWQTQTFQSFPGPCTECEQPSSSSALTGASLGINFLRLGSLGCKSIRPGLMSLKFPAATGPGWAPVIKQGLPSSEPPLPTCLFPLLSSMSSSYKEGLRLIHDTHLSGTRI